MQQKIVEMADLGVSHLNLHQLRLTPYSLPRFADRPYTYLHGEKVTVLESELLALELMAEAAETGCQLPINYCSFVFKNRWQKVAARHRNGHFMRKGWEDLTESGLIRSLFAKGEGGDSPAGGTVAGCGRLSPAVFCGRGWRPTCLCCRALATARF